jgi:hypothetical protein
MQIGNEIIIIPSENPIGYALDWRSRVARALTTLHLVCPKELATDPFLKKIRRYFQLVDHNIEPVNRDEYDRIQRVLSWYYNDKSEYRRIMEALLLAAAPFDAIAADIGINVNDVRMYERLCFNVRDDQGQMKLGDVQRLMIVQQDSTDEQGLKLMAVRGGYKALCSLVGITPHWKEAPDINIQDQTVQTSRSLLYRNLIRGQCQPKDLAVIEANDIKRQQIMVSTRQPDEEKKEFIDPVGLRILKMMAPKMIETTLTEEEKEIQNKLLQQKFQTEAKINSTPIVDHGVKASVAVLNEGIASHLAGGNL